MNSLTVTTVWENSADHNKTKPIQIIGNFTSINWKFSEKNSYFHIFAQNSKNKKNNVYPCKLQFYFLKVGFRVSELYRPVFVMQQTYICFFLFFVLRFTQIVRLSACMSLSGGAGEWEGEGRGRGNKKKKSQCQLLYWHSKALTFKNL